MEPDFSGYATKAGLKCSDGRTITPEAFKHQDKMTVPLVWQHGHNDAGNVLGHAILEARDDGIYAYAFLNETPSGKSSKMLVEHGDVKALSIYANKLVERAKTVLHGTITEVSLVLAGANPGALIDYVRIAHSDGEIETLEDEAIITTGLELEHADANTGPTVQDIYDSMSKEQKDVLHFMVAQALEEAAAAQHSDTTNTDTTITDPPADEATNSEGDLEHKDTEGQDMSRNVFEQNGTNTATAPRATLTHDQLTQIVTDAKRLGSFKESFLMHVVDYGIENIDYLFPDAKTLDNAPELVSRKMEWVSTVVDGARHNPFSRIKTISADITQDEARAKGYIKGNLKKEEWFGLNQRVTTPQTIYKKQKLDRDDIIDITDLDVVAWLKAEMRIMLEEELARAILIGDGREVDDEDKIQEDHIRPIAYEDDFYAHKVVVAANVTGDALVEAILRARPMYRGAGNPTMFMTEDSLTDLLLIKDGLKRRLYPTAADVAAACRVSNIVTVPVMEDVSTDGGDLLAILVNMSDYTIGADKGGAVSMFDDFDIDYNQYKYLMETRVSGALTKFKTALVFSRATGATEVTPNVPTFVSSTGVVTIPSQTGVVYKNQDTDATLTAGAQTAIAAGSTISIVAVPDTNYYFPHNTDADWDFTRPA